MVWKVSIYGQIGRVWLVEDKNFDLISKVYEELTELRKENDVKFENIEKRLNNLEVGQKKIETIIEHDIKTGIVNLYDGYKKTYKLLKEIDEKLDTISENMCKQEKKFKYLGGKK